MMISARTTAFSAGSHLSPALRWMLPAALLVAITASGSAEARGMRAGYGAYNGTWNVMFTTRAGNCSSNSFPFSVYGSRVSSAGGGKVTGGISRNGIVAVSVSVGLSHASGTGRLAGNYGAGRWSGIITGDRCSGSWQAARS
ncbi:MAG TPA: hypothetical protein VFQ87_08985 [Bradyrhizobium sp.]|jgi:hypothetical protein|nr:hypothetical protein [Bradyrhizobium sp.]